MRASTIEKIRSKSAALSAGCAGCPVVCAVVCCASSAFFNNSFSSAERPPAGWAGGGGGAAGAGSFLRMNTAARPPPTRITAAMMTAIIVELLPPFCFDGSSVVGETTGARFTSGPPVGGAIVRMSSTAFLPPLPPLRSMRPLLSSFFVSVPEAPATC